MGAAEAEEDREQEQSMLPGSPPFLDGKALYVSLAILTAVSWDVISFLARLSLKCLLVSVCLCVHPPPQPAHSRPPPCSAPSFPVRLSLTASPPRPAGATPRGTPAPATKLLLKPSLTGTIRGLEALQQEWQSQVCGALHRDKLR